MAVILVRSLNIKPLIFTKGRVSRQRAGGWARRGSTRARMVAQLVQYEGLSLTL